MEHINIIPNNEAIWDESSKSFQSAVVHVNDIAAQDGSKYDIPSINLSECEFVHDGQLRLTRNGKTGIPLRETAFQQVCSAIKAPASYIRELPLETALDCLNWNIREKAPDKDSYKLRTVIKGRGKFEGRALVSGRYAPLDDIVVLEEIEKALYQHDLLGRATVRAISTGGTLTNIRVAVQKSVGPDSLPVWFGFDIRNCELGLYSLRIAAMVWRMVCTNGMVVSGRNGADARWRHIGSSDRLRDAFSEAIPVAIKVSTAQHEAMGEAHGQLLALPEATKALSVLDLTKAEQKVALVHSLREASLVNNAQTVVIDDIDPRTVVTKWHLVNGVTASAREVAAPRRLHIETEAGKLLAA